MGEHGGHGQAPLRVAIAEQAAERLPDGGDEGQGGDHRGGRGQRHPDARAQVRHQVHDHRRDHQQRRGVPHAQHPERPRPQRLAQREVARRVAVGHLDRATRAVGQAAVAAVDRQAVATGLAPQQRGAGEADEHEQDAGSDHRRPPPDGHHRAGHQGHQQAAGAGAERHPRHRGRTTAPEPGDDGGRHREEARQVGAEPDDGQDGVVAGQRRDPAQQRQAGAEHDQAEEGHAAGPEAVEREPLHRPQQAAQQLDEREAARDRRGRPAELGGEHHHVHPEDLRQQRRLQQLQPHGAHDHPPAEVDAAQAVPGGDAHGPHHSTVAPRAAGLVVRVGAPRARHR